MKKCPYCAEEIKDEAIKCRFCGEFLTPVSEDKGKSATQAKPETKPQRKAEIPQSDKTRTEAKQPQKISPPSPGKEKKPELKQAPLVTETAPVEMKEATAGKSAVASLEKPKDVSKKKKDWVLIIAIIVFGILLLIIQFSKQLGIEGFP